MAFVLLKSASPAPATRPGSLGESHRVREIFVAFAACDSPRSGNGLYEFFFFFFVRGEKRKRNTIRKTISQKHIKPHGGRSKTDVPLAAGEPNNIIFRARREAEESEARVSLRCQ